MNHKKYNFKCFKYLDNYYIFDGQSQTAICVKYETWELFRKIKNGETIAPSSKSKEFIDKLLCNQIVQEQKNETKAPNFFYSKNMLSLVHSLRCNLRCQYCFSHNKTSDFDMDIEVAKKAILFFIEKFAPKGNKLIIDLTSAGEPLVNKNFVMEISKFITNLRNTAALDIHPALITNGMLLTEEWKNFFLEHGVFWAISLDCNKLHHEKARTGADYDKIIKNYKMAKTSTLWYYYGIRATYTAENCNITEIFESLFKVGFGYPITINPARNEKNGYGVFTNKNIKKILNYYDDFCQHLLNFTLNLDLGRIHSYFSGESYFRKFIGSILHKTRIIYRCSAGVQDIAVDKNGDFYVCTTLTGKQKALIGNLERGIDSDKQKEIKQIYADNLPSCSKCWARYNCAGTCMAESLNINDTLSDIVPVKCTLTQHLIKLAIYYSHQVYTKRPDILRYIQEKY